MIESGSPETAEVSPKKGLMNGYKEARRRHSEAERQAVKEFETQWNQFWNWAGKQGNKMPVVQEFELYRDKVRKGVWSVEGKGEKKVSVTYHKLQEKEGEREVIRGIEIEDPGKEEKLSVRNRNWSLSVGDVSQRISFDNSSQDIGNIQYYQEGHPRGNAVVPDVLDYSRGVLDFLEQAKMQTAVPSSQPDTGQPKA